MGINYGVGLAQMAARKSAEHRLTAHETSRSVKLKHKQQIQPVGIPACVLPAREIGEK